MKKPLTNEQRMRKLLKELHPIEIAILRERIETICDLTLAQLSNPEKRKAFENPIFGAAAYESTMKRVKAIVNTEE